MSPSARTILAAVVAYNPGEALAGNLAALRAQVADVVVIDNGSVDAAGVRRVAEAAGCGFQANPVNLGLGGALNQAVELACRGGYARVALFDQDSRVGPGAVAGLLRLIEAHPQAERIGVAAMSRRDAALGRDHHRVSDILEETPDWRAVRVTMTSGSLISLETFDRIGPFDEGLFIDQVDHDFCLRCRKAGLLVIEARHQVLEHALGEMTPHPLFGRTIYCSHHSALRRYYITRNTLEVARRHLAVDARWCLASLAYLVVESLLALRFEDDRRAKLHAMLRGGWDFARRRFGPLPRV